MFKTIIILTLATPCVNVRTSIEEDVEELVSTDNLSDVEVLMEDKVRAVEIQSQEQKATTGNQTGKSSWSDLFFLHGQRGDHGPPKILTNVKGLATGKYLARGPGLYTEIVVGIDNVEAKIADTFSAQHLKYDRIFVMQVQKNIHVAAVPPYCRGGNKGTKYDECTECIQKDLLIRLKGFDVCYTNDPINDKGKYDQSPQDCISDFVLSADQLKEIASTSDGTVASGVRGGNCVFEAKFNEHLVDTNPDALKVLAEYFPDMTKKEHDTYVNEKIDPR